MTNGEPLRFTTHCRMCQKTWSLNDLSIPVIGKTLQERLVGFVSLLVEHLQKNHPEELQLVAAAVRDVYGLEVLRRFTHEEPVLLNSMNEVRKAFHWAMQGPGVNDAELQDKVARLALNNGEQEKVIELCKSLRDYLTETPTQPQNAVPEHP